MNNDEPASTHVFRRPEGVATIVENGDGTRRIAVKVQPGVNASPRQSMTTHYPLALIQKIIDVKGIAWVCDDIARDEDPEYVEHVLRRELLAFVPLESTRGARILDFGCGSGASTACLARVCPDAEEIVGTDFQESFMSLARDRIAFWGYPRSRFVTQSSPLQLPDVGEFDYIVLSAVVEHMFPNERRELLPKVWERLKVGGRMFISDTPHRWFPVEAHTTMLWGLNFQSDQAAHARVKRHRIMDGSSWEDLLRAGIRGSTEREIVECLTAGSPSRARIVVPTGPGINSRADLWRQGLAPGRRQLVKSLAHRVLSVGERLTGSLVTQNLTLCLERMS